MAADIKFIENQFAYLRKRHSKGDISLNFELTKEQVEYFKSQGYEVICHKEGFFKKNTYDVIQKG